MADHPVSPSSSKTEALAALVSEFGAEHLPDAADGIAGILVDRDSWLELARQLRDQEDLRFDLLVDVTAVDWPDRQPRFEVVYHLWSLTHNRLLRVKVGVPEEQAECPSVVLVWGTANWHEREVFDMYGVRFAGHPDLRRILMPDDYPYHPLRKDFPLEGVDNSVSYRNEGGVLMTQELFVDRPAGQDPTPVDRSKGDPQGYSDGAAPADES